VRSERAEWRRSAKRDRQDKPDRNLALPRLKPALGLVDDIDPALAADEAVIAMATAQGLQRITDFHGLEPSRAAVTRANKLLELRRTILIGRSHVNSGLAAITGCQWTQKLP
jgi:hypothetical protein